MITVGVSDQPRLDSVIASLEKELDADYAPPHIKRHAHPKMHGCVQAVFRVDADVPPELRHGIFANSGKEYRAWVRFSNAFGISHDLKFETRGMAIKVLGVTGGERLLPAQLPFSLETDTQDFVMSTHDAFVLPNVKDYDYAEFSTAARQGFIALVKVFVKHRLGRGLIALVRGGIVQAINPLAIRYFSQTPYGLGRETVVKLHARPCLTKALARSLPGRIGFAIRAVLANTVLSSASVRAVRSVLQLLGLPGTMEAAETFCDRYIASRHLLRHALSESLANSSARFEIMVQKYVNDAATPIHDPTVRWTERQSPFRRVATLTIPRQVFWPAAGMPPKILKATIDMVDDGENMSFTPWHGLTDHQPLGDINLARGRIYAAISTYRRDKNMVTPPNASEEYDRLRDSVQHGLMEPWPERGDP
jgi:hypothetical protein